MTSPQDLCWQSLWTFPACSSQGETPVANCAENNISRRLQNSRVKQAVSTDPSGERFYLPFEETSRSPHSLRRLTLTLCRLPGHTGPTMRGLWRPPGLGGASQHGHATRYSAGPTGMVVYGSSLLARGMRFLPSSKGDMYFGSGRNRCGR